MMNDDYLYAHNPPALTNNIVRIIDNLKTNTREVDHVPNTDICLRVSEMGRLLQLSNTLIDPHYSTSIWQLGMVLNLTYNGSHCMSFIAKTNTSAIVKDRSKSNRGDMFNLTKIWMVHH